MTSRITDTLALVFAFLLFGVNCGREFPPWDPLESAAYMAVAQIFKVAAVSPTDGAIRQGIGTTVITISFNRAVAPSSIATNAAEACTGSLQVSTDGFASCIPMSAPIQSADGRTYTLSPHAAFQSPVTYRFRALSSVTAVNGQRLGQDFSSGFVTSTLTFMTTSLYTGNLGGISGADAKCMADAGYPGFGVFKAFLVDGVNRSACATAQCNWVFQPTRDYYRSDGTTIVASTNAQAVTGGTLTTSFTGTGSQYWTGLDAAWGNDPNDCGNWMDSAGGTNGTFGIGNSTTSTGYGGGTLGCNVTRALICVQQ